MAWSYDASDIDVDTISGRINAVRLLVGDTDTCNQQVQNEEITFALTQTQDNVYSAASWVANTIASQYARRVDVDLDGQLSAKYSQLHKHYKSLSVLLDQQGRKYSGTSLGVSSGGVLISQIDKIRSDTNRVTPTFRTDRFKYPQGDYLGDYENK